MTKSSRHRRGRGRDLAAQRAILQATQELLTERGYQRMSIEAVARRAGVGKATIYRWWNSKAELMLEAASDHLEIGRVPDTENTRDDLVRAGEQLIRALSDPLMAIVVFVIVAQLDDDPELADRFRERWVTPWRASLADAIARGVARGDLPRDTDVAFALDVIVGTIFQRTLVVPTPMTEGLPEQLADLLLGRERAGGGFSTGSR